MADLELVQLHGSSHVVPGPTNIGVIIHGSDAFLVDSGNDKEAGRKILRLCESKGLSIKAIINTHSNADHIGANAYLQAKTGCRIFATKGEQAFIESPRLEPGFLWGGFAGTELDNKFFVASPSKVTDSLGDPQVPEPEGIEIIGLPGHFVDMVGVLTEDRVFYIADCMFGPRVMEKHRIPFVYDVAAYKATIERVRNTNAACFVMSHGEVETDIGKTAADNLELIARLEGSILDAMAGESSFEKILAKVATSFGIDLGYGQYALVGSTVRSFLSYLANEKKAIYRFKDNGMLWSRCER
ncbi:MAG: MBL fold metallo-hydrolase [Spirochaetota bacterium]